jgi:hypothetical protein
MLLEVMLMVSIIMMVYPIINRQTSKQKSKMRDILIVKEISTIKTAFEKFLLRYVEDIPNDICTIDLSMEELTAACDGGGFFPIGSDGVSILQKVYGMGLPRNLGKGTNMLGQTYSVRVRKKKLKGNVDMVEAMVITKAVEDLDVEDLTIRSIARELGFSGGYVEDDLIIGINWGSDPDTWGATEIEEQALISKLDPIQADKSLLVKYPSSRIEDNTMLTDILMNNNDITLAKEIDTKEGKYLRLLGENVTITNAIDVKIDEEFKVLNRINYDTIDFKFGLLAPNGTLKTTGGNNIDFTQNFSASNLELTSTDAPADGSRSPAMMKTLEVNEGIDEGLEVLRVKGVLYLNSLSDEVSNAAADDVLKIKALYGKSISNNGNTNASVKNNNGGCSSCALYLNVGGVGADLSTFRNIVVTELNTKLNSVKLGTAPAMYGKPENPGIVVKYDTTLGELLEALEREVRVVSIYMRYFDPNDNSEFGL